MVKENATDPSFSVLQTHHVRKYIWCEFRVPFSGHDKCHTETSSGALSYEASAEVYRDVHTAANDAHEYMKHYGIALVTR
jgi:hypothetical protein